MNKIILEAYDMDPTYVKTQFDEILVREITSLIEIDSDIALLTYNLSTVSTIIVAVERERDIRSNKDNAPPRFTIETLIDELVQLGLSKDDTLIKSVESVIEQAYLSQNQQGELKAEVSAYTIVGFLDKMFPGMQGIQLIAFVMQMIDEVLSERKTLEDAKNSFAQTLKHSGVAVTREKAEKKAAELALDNSQSHQMKEVALKLKEANIKRLAQQKLREKLEMYKAGGKPSFHFDGGSRLDKVRIRSVFDSGPSQEEIEAEKRAQEELERRVKEEAERKLQEENERRLQEENERRIREEHDKRVKEEAERQYKEALLKAAEIEERERKIREAEAAALELERKAAELAAKEQRLELEAKEKALREAQIAALKLEQQQAELRAKEAEMAAREAELRLKEEQLRASAQKEDKNEYSSNNQPDYDSESEISDDSDDIESRIAAFEAELTISCPVCHNGKVKKEKTQAGKEYFICSDKNCRFVSWSQPYPFECPLCKNSFLVDFISPSGTKGLKCPRASCSFTQNHLSNPSLTMAIQSEQPIQQSSNYTQPPFYPNASQTSQPSTSGYPQQPQSGYVSQPNQQIPIGTEPPKKKRLVRRVKR